MNPTGVSVFYGAFNAKTCLAEIRLPVGATAVTASFRVVRPINVLDLTVLEAHPLGFSLRALGQVNLKNSVPIVSPNVLLIDRDRHAKRSQELTPGAFSAVLSDFQIGFDPFDGQPVVVHTDIECSSINSRKINCHRVRSVVFVDVGRWMPIRSFNLVALLNLSSSLRRVFK